MFGFRRLAPGAAMVLSLTLAGCQGPVVLVFAPEAQELLPVVRSALPAVERQTGLRFTVAAPNTVPPSEALYFSADTPTPEDLAALPVVPVSPDGLGLVPALVRRGQPLPLFWDVPGITVFSDEWPAGGFSEDPRRWVDPARGWPRVRALVIGGADPGLRLMAWLGQSGSDGSLPTTKMFQEFRMWLERWDDGAWKTTRAQIAPKYRGGRGQAFIETAKDFHQTAPGSDRRFFPLISLQAGTRRWGGSVLALEARGGDAAGKAARAWATPLTETGFQKEFHERTGWLPATLAAGDQKLPAEVTVFTSTASVTPAVRDQLETLFFPVGTLGNR